MVKELPLSGSERTFNETGPFGRKGAIVGNNCYSYAFGDVERGRLYKSVPGERSWKNWNNHTYTHCRGLTDRVLSDNPKSVYRCNDPNKACKRGYYKVMLFVAPARPSDWIKQGDFHWYRQDKACKYKIKEGDTTTSIARFFKVSPEKIKAALRRSRLRVPTKGRVIAFPCNMWSHKRGWATGPLYVDAKGAVIKDPRKASRAYESLNYKTYCDSFCVKRTGIKVGHTHPKVFKQAI